MRRLRKALNVVDLRRAERAERARLEFISLGSITRSAKQLSDLVELAASPATPQWLKFGVAEVMRRQADELSIAHLWRVWSAGRPFCQAVGRSFFRRLDTLRRLESELRPRWIPRWVWELAGTAGLDPASAIANSLSERGVSLVNLRHEVLRIPLRTGLGSEVTHALLDQVGQEHWKAIEAGEVPDWAKWYGGSVLDVVLARSGRSDDAGPERSWTEHFEAMLSAWWDRDPVWVGRCAYWVARADSIADCRRVMCTDGYVNLIALNDQTLGLELDSGLARYLVVDLGDSSLSSLELAGVVSTRGFSTSRLFGLFSRNTVSIGTTIFRVVNTIKR